MPRYGNYNPATFGWAPNADIVPFEYRGAVFAQGVARRAVPIFQGLIDDLIDAGYKLRTGGSMDTGNWGYTFKTVTGGGAGAGLSFHAFGLALDFDAPHNAQHATPPGTLPHNSAAIARKWGCEWGGSWNAADWDRMHFQLHAEPGEIPAILAVNGAAAHDTPVKDGFDMADMNDLKTAIDDRLDAKHVLTHADIADIADAAAQRAISEFGRKAAGSMSGKPQKTEDELGRISRWALWIKNGGK